MKREDKERYIDIIHRIWPSAQSYTADDVNEEAARVTDLAVKDIAEASKSVAILETTARVVIAFYVNRVGSSSLASDLYSAITDLLDVIEGKRRYQFIIQSPALKYRSMIEIALMDI